MHRLYSPSKNISVDRVIINDKEQVHHARDVLRLKLDEEVTIFDDTGNEYVSILEKASPEGMLFKIEEKKKFIPKLTDVRVTIACAIPKDSRMDEIVDKLTQLGVNRIIPLETERVIVKLDKHKKVLRRRRWEKIALNASLQSQRNTLPVLEPIKKMQEVLSDLEGYDLKLIPTLGGERETLKTVLLRNKPKNILVFIGPEGDFTPDELRLAKKSGCTPVSLGNLVLRVDTAAVTVAGFIRLQYENH